MSASHNLIIRITAMSFVAFIIAALLYSYEYLQTTSTVYDYFRHVQTKQEFYYPEEITSYTFGRTAGLIPRDLEYVNQLWCKPYGSNESKSMKATRVAFYEDFMFQKNTPTILTTTISEYDTVGTVGLYDAELIRGTEHEEWSLGGIKPRESSICNVTTQVTGWTKLFKIPKITKYQGADFDYFVE